MPHTLSWFIQQHHHGIKRQRGRDFQGALAAIGAAGVAIAAGNAAIVFGLRAPVLAEPARDGALIQRITDQAQEEAKDKSRQIILQAIQRYETAKAIPLAY